MRRLSLLALLLSTTIYTSNAQEAVSSSPLEISGSADVYWKYDFAKSENIGTYFGNEHNSLSLGMLDLALKKSTGKASFVGELSFGPRGQDAGSLAGSLPNNPSDGNSFHIQNLYASYAFTEKFSMTAGYMGTFVGYEVISPAANFHYSTSYLFSSGPFQNAGIKADYAISDKVGVMVGLFNDWNVYQDMNGLSHFGAQLSLAPVEGLSTYFNFLTGSSEGGAANYSSGTILDLVASYDFSDKFSLGLNAADYSMKDSDDGYSGIALYPKVNITENFGLGLRGEYFKWKDVGTIEGDTFTTVTISANLKHGGLTFIPEFRLDNSKQSSFFKDDFVTPTKNASQFSLALVYAF
jgi:hypothetical protein